MLEDMVGYLANGAIGATGAGLIILNRGAWGFDRKRGVNVATENSLSARIIKHFPKYRHISSPLDHFVEGIAMPYAFGGALGLMAAAASQYLGFDIFGPDLRPEYMYQLGWVVSVAEKVAFQIVSAAKQRRKPESGDYAQLAADAVSLAASGALVANNYWL